ncbi:MAG: hypothetical protein DHS20C16_29650 [Phycisphaerae bacterium]|nr:MAG: hypothetical protein DHS20C16_29650 [Phycisphaerae bacterium]
MTAKRNEPSFVRIATAGLLAWVLPGLGHVYLGDKKRGMILMVVVAATFWGGVAVAGVQSSVQPNRRKAWFVGQICAGSHTLAALGWGQLRERSHPNVRAGFVEEDVAIIFTGVAGMLNILIILDVLAMTDPNYIRRSIGPPMQSQPTQTQGSP